MTEDGTEDEAAVGPPANEDASRPAATEGDLLAARVAAAHGAGGIRVVLDECPTLHDLPSNAHVEVAALGTRLGGVARAGREEGAHEREEG